jgi:hypothetical protein
MDMEMVRQHLDGAGFPASKHDVMMWATQHGAGTEEIEMLKKLPVDTFDSIQDVLGAAGMVQKKT